MAILLDTSVLIAIERRGLSLDMISSVGPAEEEPAIAAISASELLVGIHLAATTGQKIQREAFVEEVLQAIQVLPFDLVSARVHAAIWAELRLAGSMVAANDLLIATTALSYGCSVLTDNIRDFSRVPGLNVLRPSW